MKSDNNTAAKSSEFLKNQNHLSVILPLYSQRGKRSTVKINPPPSQSSRRPGNLTHRRHLTIKSKSNVSQMVADLEEVLNTQEKDLIAQNKESKDKKMPTEVTDTD